MRIRRTFPIALVVVMVAAAVTLAVQLRKQAPPEPARLLPGADAFFYLDLSWARRMNSGKDLPAVSHDPEYERFIRETGFQFERDLDEAAFAVHYPASWPGGGTGGSAREPRFSEVLVGKFHSERLANYLRQIAQSVEDYHSVDIFTIPVQNRLLRVAVLSPDSVAASNHEDAAVIEAMVDRSKRLASPFGGPALLRQYYRHVQLASLVWVVARIDPSTSGSLQFTKPATLVASGTFLSPLHLHANAVHLRADAFTQSNDDARSLIDKVDVFLALTHTAESAVGLHGTDPEMKAFFDSFKVKQDGDRAVLTASMPLGFLHKMFSELPAELPLQNPQPEAAPAQPKAAPAPRRKSKLR